MDSILKTATRWILILAAIALLVYAVFPSWKTVTLGFAVGLMASAMNGIMLKRRVALIAEIAIREGESTKRRGLGFGSRAAMILLVAMLAFKFPDKLNLPAALSGSMVFPFICLAVAFIHNAQRNRNGKG